MRVSNRWFRRVVLSVILSIAVFRFAPIWKIRFVGAKIAQRVPDLFLPTPFLVLPPPDSEYLGVWEVPPDEARRRLNEEYGFEQMIRAYLHAYESDGRLRYEVASCCYRPDGIFGMWQLHIRLFPTGFDRTELWCHWERNPNVAPIRHLRQDGYDPAEGKRQTLDLLDEPLTVVDQPER